MSETAYREQAVKSQDNEVSGLSPDVFSGSSCVSAPRTRTLPWETLPFRFEYDAEEYAYVPSRRLRWPWLPLFRVDKNASKAAIGQVTEELSRLVTVSIAPPLSHELAVLPRPRQETHALLELIVTTSCNNACTYCYATMRDGYQEYTARQQMPVEIMISSCRKLLAIAPQTRSLNVLFFGGEPLLRFQQIQQFASWCHELAAASGIRIQLLLATNLVDLDSDEISFLVASRVGVQVSLDGPEAVHDFMRRSLGGALLTGAWCRT